MDFSRETGNLDVCVNSPGCEILSTTLKKKTVSLNTLKAKQNGTHLQGGPNTQATRMWPLPYAHTLLCQLVLLWVTIKIQLKF